MRVDRIDTVKPCISDPWKLRVIVYLDEQPNLQILAQYLEGRYSESLGVVIVRSGLRELNFFLNSQMTDRSLLLP
jgi:ArsR family metal-binding transcriptional regulator